MFAYYEATPPHVILPAVTTTNASEKNRVAVTPTAKHVPRRGHLAIAGRYTKSRKLEAEVALERTVLGEGMSSFVRLSTHCASRRKFAVKSLQKKGLSASRMEELRAEVETQLTVDHPHISRVEQVYEDEKDIHIVLEHLAGQELFDRIVQRGRFSEQEAADAMRQMLSAVQYMHGHGLVHRDLKPENFMYTRKNGSYLKLIDFGFARKFEKDEKMSHLCGTLYYMAPEVIANSYTEKADMWSMGIILYTILVGGVPWDEDDDKTLEMVTAGKPNYDARRFGRLSGQVQKLIKALLSKDPAKRPSATEALAHPWLSSFKTPQTTVSSAVVECLQEFEKTSPLKRTCMSMAAWSLSLEDQEAACGQFEAFGADDSGSLAFDKFVASMKRVGVDETGAEKIFRSIDLDGDNEIAFSEFLAALAPPEDLPLDVLHLTFGRFDADGDGKITKQDLRSVLGRTLKAHKYDALVRLLGDSSGVVAFEEFCSFMKQPHELSRSMNLSFASTSTASYSSATRSASYTSSQSVDEERLIMGLDFSKVTSRNERSSLNEAPKHDAPRTLLGMTCAEEKQIACSLKPPDDQTVH